MNPKRVLLFVTLVGLLGVLITGCDDVVDDPTFRMWCGESLCSWKLESGTIRRAPTWNKKDYGVEFVDTPTAISQETTKSPKCLEFTTIADVDPSAQVTIGIDFNRDGIIDQEQPIAATGFHEAKTQVTAPAVYDGIRFVISKKGSGRVVLAQLRVQSKGDCTAPPVTLKDSPLGTACMNDGECHSGKCCENLCSECCGNGACGEPDAGTACKLRDGVKNVRGVFQAALPRQCGPGDGSRMPGDECLANDDCASNVCEGASTPSVRLDSKADGGLAACPPTFPDAGEDCVYGAMRAGRCK